jgi:hypothetical protein
MKSILTQKCKAHRVVALSPLGIAASHSKSTATGAITLGSILAIGQSWKV